MTKDFEAIVYSHRQHPLHAECAEAWFRYVPMTCRFTIIREPGTAAQNSNRALERCRSRYLFLLDEDAILCQHGWAESMLEMVKLPDFGIGSCRDVPNAEAAKRIPATAEPGPFMRYNGLPGFVFLLDMQRMAGLRLDEQCPGTKGMTDVDLCVQARVLRGLATYRNDGAFLIHKEKPTEAAARLAAGFNSTLEQEANELYPAQCRYMDEKWGLNKWSALPK